MLQAISIAVVQWITAVLLMAPCGPMCIFLDGSSQASCWAPLLNHGQSMSHHIHTASAGCKSSLQVTSRGRRSTQVDLQWVPNSFGWLLQITFSASLDPPLSKVSEFLADLFCNFWSIFGPNFGSQKRSPKWASKSGFNRILNKAANLRPILGSKNGPQNGPQNLHLFWISVCFLSSALSWLRSSSIPAVGQICSVHWRQDSSFRQRG